MRSIWRLRSFLRPYRLHMVTVIGATIGVTSLNLIGPWILRELVRLITERGVQPAQIAAQVLSPQTARHLVWLAALFAGAHLLRAGFQFVTSYVAHVMAWTLVSDLRIALYHHLQKLSLRFYQDKQTGEVMSRVVNDTDKVEPLIAHNIPDLIVNSLLLVGITGILFYLSPELALLTLIPIPVLAIAVFLFSERMRLAFKAAQEKLADFNAVLQDNISGMKEIQIFTRERHEGRRVSTKSRRYTIDLLRALRIIAVYHPTVELLGTSGTLIVLFFGGRAALEGRLAVEDLVAFLLYLSMFYQPVMLLARMNEQVQLALAGGERAAELMAVEPDVREARGAVEIGRVRGEVRFEGVSFHYVPGVPVLRDISFVIRPGESLALVGPTGVGKSTIASLIPRFYDPVEGRVLIDGHDVRTLRLRDLRRNVSMVLQDVFLFNGTVFENIAYGNPNATEADVIAAARIANAHEFISALPDGYQTAIGER
ncbi:MAG TPA: ABC transporter ATP-binding protein, partial [Limnochordia bacterium]